MNKSAIPHKKARMINTTPTDPVKAPSINRMNIGIYPTKPAIIVATKPIK